MKRALVVLLVLLGSAVPAAAQPVPVTWRPPSGCSNGQTITFNLSLGIWQCGSMSSFSTNNVIPRGNGTGLVASSLADDGSNVQTPLSMFVGIDTGTATKVLNVGRNTALATNAQNGWSVSAYSDGNVYIDSKTFSGGSTFFRVGNGTESGANKTWLTVANSTGNATLGSALTINGPASGNALTAANTQTGQTGSAMLVRADSASTFVPSSGVSMTGVRSYLTSSRTGGAGSLTNIAADFSATGGDANIGLRVVDGTTALNTGSGNTCIGASSCSEKLSVTGNASVSGTLTKGGVAVLAGTISANTIPKGSSGNLANSAIVDDGSTVTITGRPLFVSNAGSYISAADEIGAFGGNTILRNGSIMFFNGTNGVATGKINNVGYLEGTTQFRNLEIDDGKGAAIALFTGSDKSVAFNGPLWAGDTASSAIANNIDVLTIGNTGTGQTASNALINLSHSGSFDATAAGRTALGAIISMTASRSAGANNVTNKALSVSASGAQANYAIETADGDNRFNVNSGSSTFFNTANFQGQVNGVHYDGVIGTYAKWWDEFYGDPSGTANVFANGFLKVGACTGGTVSLSTTPGSLSMTSDGTSSNPCYLTNPVTSEMITGNASGDTWTAEAYPAMSALAGALTWYWIFGFGDTTASGNEVDGCYFAYDKNNQLTAPGTGNANSSAVDKWKCWCSANSVRTGYIMDGSTVSDGSFTTVNAPIDITGDRLKIVWTNGNVSFYVNDVKSCQITTNIPSGGGARKTAPLILQRSTTGLPGTVIIDAVMYTLRSTNGRS